MSAETPKAGSPKIEHPQTETAPAIWREGLLVWAALMVLLGLTLMLAYVPLGRLNPAVSMVIAVAKAALVVLVFMRLRKSPALMALAMAAGLFWLATLFGMTFTDYPLRQSGERVVAVPSERAAHAIDGP